MILRKVSGVTSQPGRQATLAHMPAPLLRCTPSRLAGFDCPRRYRFSYLDRPAPPKRGPWAHNSMGAVVHLALHRWWQLAPERRTPDAGARLVERNWSADGFRDERQAQRWRAAAAGWVARYLTGVDAAAEPVGVERTVGATTARLALSGRVDRIDARGEELVVVDYKTGRTPCTEDDARGSQALALYVLGVRRTLRRACRRVELHHLPTGTVASFEHTEQSLARHVERAEQTASDIVAATDTLAAGAHPDEVFPPAPGQGCSWCDFRQHCPEGRSASRSLEPWAGLPTEDEPDSG
jgi:RecB family exonuclease